MRTLIVAIALATCPALAAAQTPSRQIPEPEIVGGRLGAAYTPLIEALRKGGLVLLFRHDRTDVTGLWDYEAYREGACDGERNLSEAGQASARAIGRAIAMLRIPIRRVISSTYCRAVDSAAARSRRIVARAPANAPGVSAARPLGAGEDRFRYLPWP